MKLASSVLVLASVLAAGTNAVSVHYCQEKDWGGPCTTQFASLNKCST